MIISLSNPLYWPYLVMLAASVLLLLVHLFVGHEGHSEGSLDDVDLAWGESFLGFINLGQVPLSMLLMSGLFCWGAGGMIWTALMGARFNASILVFLAGFVLCGGLALLLTRSLSQLLSFLFRDHSAVVQSEDLVGCVGVVISGTLPPQAGEYFGRVHVYSEQGVLMQISAVTHPECSAPDKQETVFITGYDPQRKWYTALRYESDDFYAYLHGGSRLGLEARLERSLQELKAAVPPHFSQEASDS
jgi:hypothetical protein